MNKFSWLRRWPIKRGRLSWLFKCLFFIICIPRLNNREHVNIDRKWRRFEKFSGIPQFSIQFFFTVKDSNHKIILLQISLTSYKHNVVIFVWKLSFFMKIWEDINATWRFHGEPSYRWLKMTRRYCYFLVKNWI